MDDMLGFDLIKDEDPMKILQLMDKANMERRRPFTDPKKKNEMISKIPLVSEQTKIVAN